MDEQQKKSKKTLKVLLILGGILITILIGAVIYFYAIGEIGDKTKNDESVACGCYMIDPAVVNDCGDPKRAFLFNINKVTSDQTCSAQCNTNALTENLLNSSTPKDSYKSCTVKSISDSRCENMILKDDNGKIITGKISPSDAINVEATFDLSTYTNYIFKINSNSVEPDKIEGNKITKKITDIGDANSIEIVATATDAQGDAINSIVCRRVIDITRSGTANVNSLTATTDTQSNGTKKLSQINISTGQITNENVKVKFSFSNNIPSVTAVEGLSISTSKGSISMSKVDIYNDANFENQKSFSVLDSYVGDLTITAEVLVDDASIGTATTQVAFTAPTTNPSNGDSEEPTKSNFVTTKSVTPECVERVESSNTATFTITVKNNKDTADTIVYIKDKLPLGFSYTNESTSINGTTTADASLVTVTPVGDSEEIIWQPSTPWTIQPNATLAITFKSTAGEDALTGKNQNEVIVNPTEIPEDPDTLRAEAVITVAQDCDNPPTTVPSTGIFDNVIIRIFLGVLILATGWFVYTRPEGIKLSQIIINSEIYKDAEMAKYKLTNPKKYFEEKILREKSRGNR